MITNGVMIAHLCLNAPPEFENLFPLKTPSLKKSNRAFLFGAYFLSSRRPARFA
jgi:hypothetical protein